ncbi:protein ENHANCED DISEASE RESISTANCE 2-like [Macadamia integrifolia]|uniref:protein ENHANCED DISEASE RESISTANCE 2-like n=1 Tax=Macadamia integrifolia TaxID=60698 RepID=UPI001C4FC8DB|nr:protein ENHANCED DISEASE RESISTANCE 2-like [Macadamia integrifolia]
MPRVKPERGRGAIAIGKGYDFKGLAYSARNMPPNLRGIRRWQNYPKRVIFNEGVGGKVDPGDPDAVVLRSNLPDERSRCCGLSRWQTKRDFVFSRQWFCGQDGSYTILLFPAFHKKRPPRSGYRRTKINPSTWEIRDLNLSPASNAARCLVTQILEVPSSGWFTRKKNHWSEFEKTVPYALLCQVAGLKEYFEANPALRFDSSTTVVHSKASTSSGASGESEDEEVSDEFYDAIAGDSSSDEEDNNDDVEVAKDGQMKLKNVSWAIASLDLKRSSVAVTNEELDNCIPPISIDASQYHGSMSQGKDVTDTNCWSCPGGEGFMIRGKTYLKDNSKVVPSFLFYLFCLISSEET